MASERKGLLEEFKEFLNRGNVVELAVAVVIGVAFAAVVGVFISAIVMPLIAAIVGEPSFDALTWTLNGSEILYGTFITSLVNFLVIAGAVFMAVKAYNMMQARRGTQEEEEAGPSEDIVLLTEIRDLLAGTRTTTGGKSEIRL